MDNFKTISKIAFFTGGGLILLTLISGSLALAADDLPPFAEPPVEHHNLYIDAATIEKGYTVDVIELRAASENTTSSEEFSVFKVGVTPNSVLEPVFAVIKEIPASHIPVEKTNSAISKIWEFDIRKVVAGDEQTDILETETLGVLEKPIFVAIQHQSKNLKGKTIYFWNKPVQEWQPLPSKPDLENNLTRAIIHLPYARLAVFEEENVHEGIASWYSYRTGHFAASTIYPNGTKLKVTNISNSPRDGLSVDIIVNDYGPEAWTGRLIDLEKHAYDHIGILGGGLMAVRVELIE
jgi:hypothetical protein